MQHGREKLLRWIDFRARTGMAEWDSVPYYDMDFAALLNLVEFAADDDVTLKAQMMLDVLFFDMAADSFYGQYATSHGRAAASHVKSAAGDSLMTLQSIAWGYGALPGRGYGQRVACHQPALPAAGGDRRPSPRIIPRR